MKILVIGSGGREHALAWKLAQSPRTKQLWCAPGNAGIGRETLSANGASAECVNIAVNDLDGLVRFASEKKADLTVVGPEAPLAAGLADRLQASGLSVWGPNSQAAQFEASKAFSQNFMKRHGIPTARAEVFSDTKTARDFASSLGGHCVIKADGLAAGKGVLICSNRDEAQKAIDEIMTDRAFGAAGERIVIQERLEGVEVSLHAFCDGRSFQLLPTSQDHKRSHDGDQGLNTGGMGAYSPAPFLSERELEELGGRIIGAWLEGCLKEGIDYRGLIYPGIMLTAEGPKVLEFNVRFGDPETQVYLTRLESDLADLLEACVAGRLEEQKIQWSSNASVCVVMAAKGYPGSYQKGEAITGLEEAGSIPNVKVFHAGTALREERVITHGGRVLGVTAWGNDLGKTRETAYQAVKKINFPCHYRLDIGSKAL